MTRDLSNSCKLSTARRNEDAQSANIRHISNRLDEEPTNGGRRRCDCHLNQLLLNVQAEIKILIKGRLSSSKIILMTWQASNVLNIPICISVSGTVVYPLRINADEFGRQSGHTYRKKFIEDEH